MSAVQTEHESSALNFGERRIFLPVSVIIPVRNEAQNLPRCLASLRGAGELFVIDSQSTDATVEVARSVGANVIQFYYQGGWPKKRQWALDTLAVSYDWVLLLDADEALTPELALEMQQAMQDPQCNGYYISLQMHFLGRRLRHCGADFCKLSLFRRGKGRFECRLQDQNTSMGDMEVHEHVIVEGKTAKLRNSLAHYNVESLSRYIRKHDEYSNWEAQAWMQKGSARREISPTLFGNQAQRRRWLKLRLFSLPGSSFLFFLYRYVFRLGFLDGVPGLLYCGFQGIQFFHIKAKIYELRLQRKLCA
jgi:glycosyltransferase involved in cell wall biosynthesis